MSNPEQGFHPEQEHDDEFVSVSKDRFGNVESTSHAEESIPILIITETDETPLVPIDITKTSGEPDFRTDHGEISELTEQDLEPVEEDAEPTEVKKPLDTRAFAASLIDREVMDQFDAPYRIEQILGVGGMGFVVKAVAERTGLIRAIKFIARIEKHKNIFSEPF